MQLKHFTLCALSLASGSSAATAATPFVQADSLRDLPLSLQQQLGVGRPGQAIADRGERFNAGCLGGDGLPQQRFLLGAVSGELVVLAVEVGGIAHYSTTVEWRRQGGRWIATDRPTARAFPHTLQELLEEGPGAAAAP